jgi:hypothetical protein
MFLQRSRYRRQNQIIVNMKRIIFLLIATFYHSVYGQNNGVVKTVMFDTGAEFLIVGNKVADELGIKYSNQGIGEHATSKTTIWQSIVASLSFVNGPAFLNVPVIIMEDSSICYRQHIKRVHFIFGGVIICLQKENSQNMKVLTSFLIPA